MRRTARSRPARPETNAAFTPLRHDRDAGQAGKTKVIAALAALVAAAAFAGSASARATVAAGGYVGALSGSHSFVALLVGERGGVRA